jgi:surface carbohydrate biosynthesis protein (TIGR04326 family)
MMGRHLLLAIGPGHLPNSKADEVLEMLRGDNTQDARLDLLLLRDDPDGSLSSRVRAAWQGQVHELSGAHYLTRVDSSTADSISRFVADMRERLGAIALATSGAGWARRFGSLWWKTSISEKNSSASDEAWWQLFRAAALRQCLQERAYDLCAVVGEDDLLYLAEQASRREGVEFRAASLGGQRFSWPRVLLARLKGGYRLLRAVLIARRCHRRQFKTSDLGGLAGSSILYTCFPRVWTERFGRWKDMYYGDLPQALADKGGVEPVFALRLYDVSASMPVISIAEYKSHIEAASDPKRAPERHILVEAFGSVWETLRCYLSPLDVLRYLRMTRHSAFREIFVWDGLDVGRMFKQRLWRSALVSWPLLLCLEGAARRLAQRLQPSLTVLYHFEFAHGRAIIEGARQGAPGAPIVGIQHGPISPMKLLYAGVGEEREASPSGAPPMPEPDVYVVDGPLAARVLERRGVPGASIKVPGAVRFDDVWAESRRLGQVGRGQEKSDRMRVLIAPGHRDTEFVAGMALTALRHDARLELIVKAHPRVSPEAVARWIGHEQTNGHDEGAKITVVKGGGIYEWMAQSDLFLATYSSTAVEAIAFGIPVILLIPNHTPDMSLYYGQAVPVLKASSAQELRQHVDRIVSGDIPIAEYLSSISPVLQDSFGATDSQAASRLAELCAELTGTRTVRDSIKAGV